MSHEGVFSHTEEGFRGHGMANSIWQLKNNL